MAFLKYVSIDVGPGRLAKIKKNYTYVLIFLIKLFQIGQKVFIFAGDFLAQKMSVGLKGSRNVPQSALKGRFLKRSTCKC
jgi:hypothetical protein